MSYANKIQSIIQELNKGLLERDEVIKLVLLAFFSGKSIFLYGPPGTAKSMIARRSALAFGEDNHFFTYLMNRFSTPEEVFGPIDIKALKENKLKRVTKGYLPCANFAFLDEIWKSSPAILNTLLTIINEKIYKDGEDNIEVPLYGLICASNEFPAANQGLEALYDRMLIRYEVLPLEQRESFENLVQNDEEIHICIKDHFNINDLEKIFKESLKIHFSKEALEIFLNIKSDIELHNQNLEDIDELIYISDRRYKNIAQLLKVCTYLNDRKEILPIDLALLEYCLWSNEKDKIIIKEILQKNLSFSNDFIKIKNTILDLENKFDIVIQNKKKSLQEKQKSSDNFLPKLQSIQKNIIDLEQKIQEKQKELNIFLSDYSYKTYLSYFNKLSENIKYESMKIEQILYNINIIKNQKHKTYKYFPKNKEELIDLINNQHVNLGDINVSNITDMSNLFNNSKRKDFSGIEEWDVSNVTNMSDMFYCCANFNQSLERWNVSNVTNMSNMFCGCVNFNQPLEEWDVSNVVYMDNMFYGCTNFNQSLEK